MSKSGINLNSKRTQFLFFVLLYVVVAMFHRKLIINQMIYGETPEPNNNEYVDICFCSTNSTTANILKLIRGKNYNVKGCEDVHKDDQFCLLTIWHFSHIAFYATIGFFAPDFFWIAMLFGLVWECLECGVECQDGLDLFF